MCKLVRQTALLLLITIASVAPAFAGIYQRGPGFEYQVDDRAITILFVNGVRNNQPEVEDSTERLIESLKVNGLLQGKYNFDHFYNTTNGFAGGGDFDEVLEQIKISDAYLALSGGNRTTYYTLLGNYYNQQATNLPNLPPVSRRVVSVAARLAESFRSILTASAGLVAVPHSQGNLLVEAAYAMLLAKGETDLVAKIRVVGVASASATTPSDRYITHSVDEIITFVEPLLASNNSLSFFSPLDANVTACAGSPSRCADQIDWSELDSLKHSFQAVYLNETLTSEESGNTLPAAIFNHVALSLSELLAVQPPGTSTFLTPPHPVPYELNGNTYTWMTQAQANSTTGYVFYCKDSTASSTVDFNVAGPGVATQFYLRFGGGYASTSPGSCLIMHTDNGGASWNSNIPIDGYYIFGYPEFSSFAQFRSHREFKYNGFPFDGYSNTNFGVSNLVTGTVLIPGSSFGSSGPAPVAFNEQFAGSSFDASKWSGVGAGAVTVSGGVANFACRSSLSTQGKYTVAGETIVIEARMAGTDTLRDTVFALYEEGGASIIQTGDTNYRGVGLYLFGTGSFALAQTGNGTSTSAFKEYRLTLSGRSAKIERGDTLNAITESVTRDLPNSISGKTFYLLVGTGGPDYCPGSVDWIKVIPR